MELKAAHAQRSLRDLARPQRVPILQRYFKTGPGGYGEGDLFLGLMVPEVRAVARDFRGLPLVEVKKLVRGKYHEERLLGYLILTLQYAQAKKAEARRGEIFRFYVRNRAGANSWDLVDTTAPYVLGAWMWEHPAERKLLYRWARSKNVWDRRLSILSTFTFIRELHFADTVALAEKLLQDEHDLIHKAVGWMLRECGKRNIRVLRSFLKQHSARMSRTTLRYAVEKLGPVERALSRRK
jgi:3-methyladenine DNA glycosylase AlkD